MTNKTEMVSVPRELLDRLCEADADISSMNMAVFDSAIVTLESGYSELRALLAAPAEDPRAVVDEPVRNQCDGCQAGIPLIRGAHRMGKPGGYPDLLSCTADRYRHPQRPVVVPEPEAFERLVIERFGFGPSQLCLLAGPDLKVMFDACLDEFERLNPDG